MIDPKEIQKQAIQTAKLIFKATMDSIDTIQNQMEKFLEVAVNQTAGLQDQYSKLIKEWLETAKKMREEFKKMTDEFLKKLEGIEEKK